MDHAEVLERLADAAAQAHGAERLRLGDSLDPALQAHLDGCATCSAELGAWRITAQALVASTPDSVRIPMAARDRILETVVATGISRGEAVPTADVNPRTPAALDVLRGDVLGGATGTFRGAPPSGPTPIRFRRLALAAAAVLAVFVAGSLLGGPLGLSPRNKAAVALAGAIAASDSILQQPSHREAVLIRSDGTKVGSVLVDPTNGQIVVLSSGAEPTHPQEYHCYLVRDGQPGVWIGPMHTEEGTSFWAGWVRDVPDLGRPGDVIQVVDGDAAPELTATF
jgi:hypothetical protein